MEPASQKQAVVITVHAMQGSLTTARESLTALVRTQKASAQFKMFVFYIDDGRQWNTTHESNFLLIQNSAVMFSEMWTFWHR